MCKWARRRGRCRRWCPGGPGGAAVAGRVPPGAARQPPSEAFRARQSPRWPTKIRTMPPQTMSPASIATRLQGGLRGHLGLVLPHPSAVRPPPALGTGHGPGLRPVGPVQASREPRAAGIPGRNEPPCRVYLMHFGENDPLAGHVPGPQAAPSGHGGAAQPKARRRDRAAVECGISRSSSVPPRQRGKTRHGACTGAKQ